MHLYCFKVLPFVSVVSSIVLSTNHETCYEKCVAPIYSHELQRGLEWVIYNMKGYLNPRWHLVTIDLRSKSCICCVLETSLTRIFAADLPSSTTTRFLGKVRLEILVANLATNFQDLIANVKKLVVILRPVSTGEPNKLFVCPFVGFIVNV